MTRTYRQGRTTKEWRKDNTENLKEYQKQYREKNKEKIRKQERERYKKNKETILKNQAKRRIPYKDLPEYKKERIRSKNRKYYQQHRQQRSDQNSVYRWENGEKIRIGKRKHWLTLKYNITVDEYDKMFNSQNGVCAICHRPESRSKNLCVDHDHVTGKIRGLLCDRCNRGLGYFLDDIASLKCAIKYLQSTS